MVRLASLMIKHRKVTIGVFLGLTLLCALLMPLVSVNYDMTDYLPPEAQSTTALNIMEEEFTQAMPNASVMVRGVSLMEAMEYKRGLSGLDGVSQVVWLDDMMDITQPLEMGDADTIEGFYKDGNALFSVAIEDGMEQQATAAIQDYIGPDNAAGGEAPALAALQQATNDETAGAMYILMPIIILILLISTDSWIEPVLFLVNIGVAILINMGTGVILGEVSFMSFAVSPILQLACSLDYGIFILHNFADNRKKYGDVHIAMQHTVKESMSTVAASAVTTLFGFLALVFMNFQIGADLGVNLAKGIVISFLASMFFLPTITLVAYKLIDRTRHRPLMPGFKNVFRVISKLAVPVIVLVAVLIVPSYMGQSRTGFLYGSESVDPNGRAGQDLIAIREEFGQSTVVAALVPKGDIAKEQALCEDIAALERVTGVMAYANTVGTAIPPDFVGEGVTSEFYGENYARIIAYTDTPSEGDIAFETVERIQAQAAEYYGESAYTLGQSTNLYDMKQLVSQDNLMVNLVAIGSIFLVLLATFRSAVLPLLLLLTIEAGIWINLAIPYFMGSDINFLGYLVLSTVQLGATVDYAILLTTVYMRNRRTMLKREALHSSLGEAFKSILVSGLTLSTAGFTLFATSSNPGISDIGLLLGRGTLFSVLMVTCFLPAMLGLLDKAIGKTTYKAAFLKPPKTHFKHKAEVKSHEA